ncbi:MAG: integrase arm-type DNA-binding domain-containing protein [Steroidobacteraceae bacterium]
MAKALTDAAIKAAKPKEKPYKLSDGKGLFLLVTPKGGRWWRLRYAHGGKEKLLSLGTYPEISLSRARARRDEARSQVAEGLDPSAVRKQARAARDDTFGAVATEWLGKQKHKLTAGAYARANWMLEKLLIPYIGEKPIAQIEPPDLLEALRRTEARGRHETAHRAKGMAGRIFRYAVAEGRAKRDPSADLRGALTTPVTRNYPAITDPARVGELLRAIDGYSAQPVTEYALKLAPLLFVRPGELRGARWEEFTLTGTEPLWRIPAERMKMREEHLVPLARQAVELLTRLHPLTGPRGYLFPSVRSSVRPISENTINAALRRLGYTREQMTGHGFRSTASTLLNEQGFPPDVIELQLAHKEQNEVRAAYNRAKRLAERRQMMQQWADYLDVLKHGVD